MKEDEIGRTCSKYEELRVPYEILVGKPEGQRPLGRCRHRWEDNFKIDF
jgi:hypothetical protein